MVDEGLPKVVLCMTAGSGPLNDPRQPRAPGVRRLGTWSGDDAGVPPRPHTTEKAARSAWRQSAGAAAPSASFSSLRPRKVASERPSDTADLAAPARGSGVLAPRRRVSQVGPFPLLQYVPTALLAKLGFDDVDRPARTCAHQRRRVCRHAPSRHRLSCGVCAGLRLAPRSLWFSSSSPRSMVRLDHVRRVAWRVRLHAPGGGGRVRGASMRPPRGPSRPFGGADQGDRRCRFLIASRNRRTAVVTRRRRASAAPLPLARTQSSSELSAASSAHGSVQFAALRSAHERQLWDPVAPYPNACPQVEATGRLWVSARRRTRPLLAALHDGSSPVAVVLAATQAEHGEAADRRVLGVGVIIFACLAALTDRLRRLVCAVGWIAWGAEIDVLIIAPGLAVRDREDTRRVRGRDSRTKSTTRGGGCHRGRPVSARRHGCRWCVVLLCPSACFAADSAPAEAAADSQTAPHYYYSCILHWAWGRHWVLRRELGDPPGARF